MIRTYDYCNHANEALALSRCHGSWIVFLTNFYQSLFIQLKQLTVLLMTNIFKKYKTPKEIMPILQSHFKVSIVRTFQNHTSLAVSISFTHTSFYFLNIVFTINSRQQEIQYYNLIIFQI